ncbi:phage portal protein [Falsiroseomonas selenitidurans]|uniref:Phage portal protein n=1 Tax=Falsiroseomonas selenitidurans TaxID=2716335 RepID=A0ABX1EC84_9PROT|nr:phage portal protein [Falsiroseomonas selenitidurans]NKC33492.1 phage portal protein [Falsiroseomonas selenitidurans]
MPVLERLIEWWNPAAAHERAVHRLHLDQLRGYQSGEAGRLTQDWMPTGVSPNQAQQLGAHLTLRRSRDMGRNNAWAAAIYRRLPAAIVGYQVTAGVTAEGKRARQAVADDWAWFRDQGNAAGPRGPNWDAEVARMVRTVVEAGDCLIVWNFRPASEGRRIPLTWRALPPDYVDATRIQPSSPDNAVIGGAEVTPEGLTAGWWLYERHPLDTLHGRPVQSRFYAAEHVDLLYEPLWLGQRRGVPWLAPVAVDLDDQAQYEKAALWKARMAASFGLIRRRAGMAGSQLGQAGKDAKGRDTLKLSPAAILDLPPGDEMTQITPPADDNFRTFWETRNFAIAAGVGLPVHMVSGDLSKANYSSLREGKLLFWDLVDQWQWHMVYDQLLRSAWRRFGEARFAAGRTTGGILPGVEWAFPKRPWVDPAKDIAAVEAELDLGLTTWPDSVAARGMDPEEQAARIEQWNPRLVELGMPVGRGRVQRPKATTATAATDPAAVEGAQPQT